VVDPRRPGPAPRHSRRHPPPQTLRRRPGRNQPTPPARHPRYGYRNGSRSGYRSGHKSGHRSGCPTSRF
jgi:hypothetical protein